jgi:hypothetical protein
LQKNQIKKRQKVFSNLELKHTSGRSSAMRYSLIVVVLEKILSVTDSGAGPPFPILYLIPKSWKVQ